MGSHTPLLLLLCLLLVFYTARTLYLLLHLYRHRSHHARTNRAALACASTSSLLCASASSLSTSSVCYRTLVILGSGGHTGEMICLLSHLDRSLYKPLLYVRASTDISSEVRIRQLELDRHNSVNCDYYSIPRSREVGQSYVTSVATTLLSLLYSVVLVVKLHPAVLVCNGPGTCFPLVLSAFLCNVLLLRRTRLVFVESFCRVQSLSLCGRLLYPLVHRFIVQWRALHNHYTLTEYIGRLC